MKIIEKTKLFRLFLLQLMICTAVNLTFISTVSAENTPSDDQLISIGKQIYRKGLLANGEPVKAFVMGDMEVLGTQFTCLNCHGQSGMGGAEGKTFTLAINPDALFKPRSDMYLERTEYDDETLENSLRLGVTPEGLKLSPAMPVYDLPELEMKALIHYLKNLSSEVSPGVTDDEIHLATIISDDVSPSKQKAMLEVLHGFFNDKNGRTRKENERFNRGPYFQYYRLKAYRKWVLHEWHIKGPPESWQKQLQEKYASQPVFAMIGGMVTGSWQPIHDFAEEKELPSLLPNTDMPGKFEVDDFYTLYFSAGMELEAKGLLTDLRKLKETSTTIQVYREDDEQAVFAAKALSSRQSKKLMVVDWPLSQGADFNPDAFMAEVKANQIKNVVFWLSPTDLEKVNLQEMDNKIPGSTYLSASMLGGILAPLPEKIGERVKLLNPFTVPERQVATFDRIRYWLKRKNIEANHPRIQGQSYYACMILGEGLMHIKRHFYRDYLLDALDHGNAKSIFSVNYPRLSFGPGQRYLAKGLYIVENPHKTMEKKGTQAKWIVPYMQ